MQWQHVPVIKTTAMEMAAALAPLFPTMQRRGSSNSMEVAPAWVREATSVAGSTAVDTTPDSPRMHGLGQLRQIRLLIYHVIALRGPLKTSGSLTTTNIAVGSLLSEADLHLKYYQHRFISFYPF
jgi:hypothetical protein